MDFNTYRPLALRTAKMFPEPRLNLRHAALGLLTELGELATEVKRVAIYGKEQTLAMTDHMIEEAGDAQWYVPLALLAVEATDEEVAEAFATFSLGGQLRCEDLADACCVLSLMAGGVALSVAGSEGIDREITILSCVALISIMDAKVAPMLAIHPDDLRAKNIAKLRLRFPDAYTDAAAEARADKGGLPATES